MRKVAAADKAERVRRILDIVRLPHLGDRYPAQLSGGQQQRVALARALVIEPSILILDEPFAALDRKLREAMQVELRQLTHELGITSLFVTHDQEEALTLSDVIAVMNQGRVEQFGTPGEIFRKPTTRFVADFMGVTNFFAGRTVATNGAGVQVEAAGMSFHVPTGVALGIGRDISVAIRPTGIKLFASQPADSGAAAGSVRQATYHGSVSSYTVALDSGPTLIVRESNDHLADTETVRFPVGARVWARWRRESVHLFTD
jgi:ABC-type Fe3+/spermidine/putrescine transport system ATPase subunit